jgi:Leucine-rich repeat (LRR) protein
VAGLDLALNNLTGAWPAAALAGLSSSLAYVNLRGNNLQGRLPESISDLRQLSVLYIDDAGLSGSLPASLGQLANLTQLSAAGNGFSGALPSSLAQLQQLRRLTVSSNALTGVFPASLLALPQLQQLDVSNNKLSGQLPVEAPPGISSSSSSLPGPLAGEGQHQQACCMM